MNDTKGSNEKKELSFAEEMNLAEEQENERKSRAEKELEKIKKEVKEIVNKLYEDEINSIYLLTKAALRGKASQKGYKQEKGKKVVTTTIELGEYKKISWEVMRDVESRAIERCDLFNLSVTKKSDIFNREKERARSEFANALGIKFDDYDYVVRFGSNRTDCMGYIIKKEFLNEECVKILQSLEKLFSKDNIKIAGIKEKHKHKMLLKDYKAKRTSFENHDYEIEIKIEY